MSCQQAPGNRFYWVERAFCDLEPSGPEKARGLIVWNHGISGTLESYKAPAPLAFRLLQARGWDVIMIKRHNLAETMAGGPLHRTVQRTLEEVKAQRKLGYRKIVLAGRPVGSSVRPVLGGLPLRSGASRWTVHVSASGRPRAGRA